MLSTDGTGAGRAPRTGHTTGLSSQPTRMATIRVALTLIRTLPTCLARTGRSGEQPVLADVQGILHDDRLKSSEPCVLAAQPPHLASAQRLFTSMPRLLQSCGSGASSHLADTSAGAGYINAVHGWQPTLCAVLLQVGAGQQKLSGCCASFLQNVQPLSSCCPAYLWHLCRRRLKRLRMAERMEKCIWRRTPSPSPDAGSPKRHRCGHHCMLSVIGARCGTRCLSCRSCYFVHNVSASYIVLCAFHCAVVLHGVAAPCLVPTEH